MLPGSTHDLTAARHHGIAQALTSQAIAGYADKGYVGAGGAIGTPYKLDKRKKLFNLHHAKVHAPGERGATALKDWRARRRTRCLPSRLTAIVQTILALHHQAS